MRLDLDSFTTEQITYEVRFARNWMHWDRAGSVWTSALRKFPELRAVRGEPAQTVFQVGRATQLSLRPERLVLTTMRPTDTEVLFEAADMMTRTVADAFQLETFSRLGVRIMFLHERPDGVAAANELAALVNVRFPTGRHFGFEGTTLHPEIALRWEGASRGATVRLSAATRKLSYFPPLEVAAHVEPIERELNGVIVDVDYYTTGDIPVGSFRPSELLADAIRVTRRDLPGFLEGL